MFAATFDVIATVGRQHGWARDFFRAGTYVMAGGAAISLLAALTGWWDRIKSSEQGTQARRTINAHATIMLTVTALVLADLRLRLNDYHTHTHPSPATLALSILAAALISAGATYGGTVVFDYGFNVETAGDHPVHHVSKKMSFPASTGPSREPDRYPGRR